MQPVGNKVHVLRYKLHRSLHEHHQRQTFSPRHSEFELGYYLVEGRQRQSTMVIVLIKLDGNA